MNQRIREVSCACGRVKCEAAGEPILSGVCYCPDCQKGGHLIEALPDAEPVLDPDSGTAYLTYRDDRYSCVRGAELLKAYKLDDKAPTERVVASCCNTAMYLKFGPSWWTSAYRARFAPPQPAIEMRNKVAHRKADTPLPDDAPSYRGYPLKLFVRLIRARLAMLFG